MNPIRMKNKPHRPRSLGEMISSAAFLGMAGWLFLEAQSLPETTPAWRGTGLYICAFFCALGAFRFAISALWERLFRPGDQ